MDVDEILTPRDLIHFVAHFYGVHAQKVLGLPRYKMIADPRAVAMWLIRKRYGYSYPGIGEIFNRDHSTVITAVRKANVIYASNGFAAGRMKALEKQLGLMPGLVAFRADKAQPAPQTKSLVATPGSFGLKDT
jgi:hypothetical protein